MKSNKIIHLKIIYLWSWNVQLLRCQAQPDKLVCSATIYFISTLLSLYQDYLFKPLKLHCFFKPFIRQQITCFKIKIFSYLSSNRDRLVYNIHLGFKSIIILRVVLEIWNKLKKLYELIGYSGGQAIKCLKNYHLTNT